MDEITTPLAKAVYEQLIQAFIADHTKYDNSAIFDLSDRLALKVQEEEKLRINLANGLANKVIRIIELENKVQALEVELREAKAKLNEDYLDRMVGPDIKFKK